MRSLASIICGLIAGWLIITEPTLIPGLWKKEIDEFVAHNQLIHVIATRFPTPSTIATKYRLAILFASIAPLFAYALAATLIYMWSKKPREIFYASLCYPIFTLASTAHLSITHKNTHQAYIRNPITHNEVYFMNSVIFVLFLYLPITISKYFKKPQQYA